MSRCPRRAMGAVRMFRGFLVPTITIITITTAAPWPALAGPDATLSLDEAAARAAEQSPLVRRARAQRGVTEARRVEADMLLPTNPGVAVSVGPTRTSVGNGPVQSDLGVTAHLEQTLEVAGQRGTRQAEVARAIEGAQLRALLAEVEARARGRATYIATLLAEAQLDGARRREELASQLEKSVRTRVETGAASDVDLRLATLERSRSQRDRLDAVQAAGDARAELRTLLAFPADADVKLSTPLGTPSAALPTLSDALALAAQRRADLKALDAQRSELDAAIVRLRREAVPSPTVFLDYERDRPGETFVRAGLAIPLPFFRRRQGDIALARAEQSRIDVERAVSLREVTSEVDRALRAAVTRREQVRLDQTEVVPAAEAALDLLTQGWRAGKFDLFRIIQATRETGDAHRRALEDLGRLWEARIELDRATGTP
jgi:cobalt-zinc-cadmium efflux system outer membrane protein